MPQMSTYNVIQHSLNTMGHSADRLVHMRRLAQAMQHPNMHVHQFGDTVFMALETHPGQALLSMHNADTPRNLVQNTIQAMHWLKHDLHLHTVVFSTNNPAVLTLAQMMVKHAGIPGMHLGRAANGHEMLYLGA